MEIPIGEALKHVTEVQSLGNLCNNDQHELILAVIQANVSLKENLTLFLLPSFPNCVKCIEICLRNLPRESIEKRGSLGRNSLIAAIILGENNLPVIEKLVEYRNGNLVNAPDALGRTSIHYAVIKCDLNLLKLLMEKGKSDPNHFDNDGNSILHQFFLFNVKSSEMLDYLINGQPNMRLMIHVPNSKAQGMNTPAMLAMKMNSPYMMQIMRTNNESNEKRDHPTVERRKIALELSLYEIQDGDLDELKHVIEKFGDSVDGNGDTLLHNFARFGLRNHGALNYCLKEPGVLTYQLNVQNRSGKTPFYTLLEQYKCSEVMFHKMMECEELDVTLKDNIEGWVPLRVALKQNDEFFFKLYERDPTALYKSNLNDVTVLMYVITTKKFDLIRGLIENHDMDLTICDDFGRNILHVCAEYCINTPYIYDYIISKLPVDPQTMINVKDRTLYGYTPLMSALVSKNMYIFKHMLLNYNPDLTIKPNSGFNFNIFTLSIKCCSDIELQKEILRRCPELASDVNELGETPIMVAIRENCLELTKILIDEFHVDINVKNNYGNTLLHYLSNYRIQDTELIELLLYGDRNISYFINESNNDNLTPYDIAIKKDNIELANAFSKFLTTEANIAQIEVNDISDERPSTYTSKNLNLYSVFRADNFWSDLRIAIENNDLNGVQSEIHRLNGISDWDNGTPLHFISTIQNIGPNIIDYLLNECPISSSCVNYQNNLGETPLHCAALRENIPLLNALLKHPNSDAKIQNKKGETPLLAAINNDWSKFSEDVIRMLVLHDPSLAKIQDYHGVSPLQASILRNHFEVMKLLIEKGHVNVHYVDNDGDCLAHFLAGYQPQDPEMIEYLMNKPHNVLKDINKRNNHGNTPLHAACKTNNENYVLYLLNQKRIDGQRLNNMNETPLLVALLINRKEASAKIIVNLVKKYPAMVNKPNLVGDLPILVAINVENYQAVKSCIEYGKIDVNIWTDKQQNTLLHYLFLYSTREIKIFEYLIEKGQSLINNQNSLGDTVLHFACRDQHTEVLHLLIQCPNIDLTITNANGDTPLMNLLQPGRDTEEIMILVKTMTSLSPSIKTQSNKNGLFPIHKAFQCNLLNISQFLIPQLDDLNEFIDVNGNNLLHYIAKYVKSDEKLMRKLLRQMLNPSDLDKYVKYSLNYSGKAAYDVARECKNDIFLNVIEMS
uniref:CSON015392 protein n=1 Tax=Culicoides sonorensis TaxID=179676 RepID=A0A336KXL7_CULSO